MVTRLLKLLSLISLLVSFLQAFAILSGSDQPQRKLLFFDLWKLDYWHNVDLRQGSPEWVPEGTYFQDIDRNGGVQSPTVWKDEASDKWRMIFSLGWQPFTLFVCESDDGISWQPLPVLDASPEGGKRAPSHVFTLPSGSGGHAYEDPIRTDGYRFRIFGRQDGEPVIERALADPNHIWHSEAKSGGEKRYMSEAVTLVSRDGLHWELKTGGNWNWGQADWYPEPPIFAFWNQARQTHTMVVRPGWGDRRQCLRFTRDFHQWSDPELLFQPDSLDTAGPVGFYGMPVMPVGNGAGYVGLLWVFHNASSEPVNSFNQFFGTMAAELTYSYDGVRFNRGVRQPFIPLNPMPEPGCTQVRPCSIVETGNEIHIYSEGHRGAHGRESRDQKTADEPLGSLVLHTLRKDGWMYLRSRGDWAHIQTKPFTLFQPTINLNANTTYGEVRYQLTDEKSQPLEGFTFEDCVPIRGVDSTDAALAWKAVNLNEVIEKVVRLEVKFRNANLYAFAMDHHFLDAQDQWLLKDDKPVERKLFDF